MSSDREEMLLAIENGEFHPYFQPLVILRTGQLQGFEILARWKHPQRGWVQPDAFIPLAERDGWIDALTAELLRKALSAAATLPPSLTLAVNMSPSQLRSLTLPGQIQCAAHSAGFSLDRLIIEITENALADDMEHARSVTHEYKSMGCKLALDDFGTGSSSLLHLQSLPFDELKVDRSFVSSMTQKRESRKIVAAVVGLGQGLGLTTVAEGVETQEQADMLLWMGCELGQGWFFGRPRPVEELATTVSVPRHALTPHFSTDAKGRVSLSSLEALPTQRLAQLQAIYDGAPVGLAFLDCNLRHLSVNRRLADMNGIAMEEHLGKTVAEIIPEIFPHIEPFIRRALKGEAIPGVEITRPASGANGERTILMSYEPARDEAREVVGVSVALVDVTELRQSEKARRETEEHFRHMLELLPQIPWIIDAEGRALDVSQRWLDITGMTDDQWRGFGWLDALHPDDLEPTLEIMRASLQTGHPIDLEYRVRRPGGEWKRLRARGAARFDEDGKILCWYGCLEHVDEDSPGGSV
ncbi:sensor domain-containing phosphodiesterase [Acidicapsa acidisoli]|uniref:sensor domain-containing phosphodiesterase n=1 Tax=Acidicapsa acidisoli TaxID=1615681 RepID=UPI0021E0E2B5|nr:EAL domain-containing protein [Acidicapsa acidisoli]